MSLTPQEEAIHLEARALIELRPLTKNHETKYIYERACEEFFNSWTKEVLDIVDKYLIERSKQ